MTLEEYAALDGMALAHLVRARQVRPEELAALANAAVAALNPELNAVVEVFEDAAAPAPGVDGPFYGVPFLAKDLVLQRAGRLNECGSRFAQGLRAEETSHLAERHDRAGLVTIGRTATPEFGFNVTTESLLSGPTRNPWDLSRSAGGSSGGAAAAVAAGIVPMAHANDGGGSIRIPAACCGLVGLKPSRGRISAGPGHGNILSGLAAEHAVTRSVRDCALLLDATAGPMPGDWLTLPHPASSFLAATDAIDAQPLKIGVTSRSWTGVAVHEEAVSAVRATAVLLESLGHEVREVQVQIDAEAFEAANADVWCASIAHPVASLEAETGRKADADVLEPATLACLDHGRRLSAVDHLKTETTLNRVSRQAARAFEDIDVLMTPVLAEPVAALGRFLPTQVADVRSFVDSLFTYAPFTALFNVTGQPAISLPLHMSRDRLPIGVQFVARPGEEHILLMLAAELERAIPWAGRRPPVHAASLASGPSR